MTLRDTHKDENVNDSEDEKVREKVKENDRDTSHGFVLFSQQTYPPFLRARY